ncbi:hypothetical protein [Rhizorhabdus sp.]|jgi:pimeloyl-ACP methyl ester carboxylesterase|uniref:alpha/beta fold hydrolase n=1 Tax=Rhizorhabdus sp. TaxID=1968843 RepID=UPI0025F848CA|nr:hypothetical protein [Rhizorhabdus sp.]
MVARYGTLSIPVSILYAPDDNILDATLHGEHTAAQIPGAELMLVEGGHMLPFTQGPATARWIRAAAARKEQTHAR